MFFCPFANHNQSPDTTVMYKITGIMWDFNSLSLSSVKIILDLIQGGDFA